MNLYSFDDFACLIFRQAWQKLPSVNNYFLSIYTSEKEQIKLKAKPDKMLVSRIPRNIRWHKL